MAMGIYSLGQFIIELPNGGDWILDNKFITYTCRNVFTYATEPSRGNDFALDNSEETIEAKYVPQISFKFNRMTPEIYSKFIQVANSRGFILKYYDYEVQMWVRRLVYMSEKELSRVQIVPPDEDNSMAYILNILGVTLTAVSKFGYESYDDIKAKASIDDRF